MIGSNESNQTTREKVDEDKGSSSTISSILIKLINQTTDELSSEFKDTLQRDQSDNQPLGEGIALPSKSIDSREFAGHRLNQDENKEEISSFAEESDNYHQNQLKTMRATLILAQSLARVK